MKKTLIILSLLLASFGVMAQDYSWKAVDMDGSRTGCSVPDRDNVDQALGTFKRGKYIAPDGSVHKKSSAAAKAAKAVIGAQPAMARVKDVIAFAPEAMKSRYPESGLSNWYVDIVMDKTEALAGKKVHIGVCNFGGIRVDMPQGNVILDDMLSMFPFRNSLVYIEHKGSVIRGWLEDMAADRFQILGGVKVVAEDGKLVSVEIDGEPLDDDKTYGVATISFLLDGGDGLYLRKEALSLTSFDEVNIIDAVLEHIYAETAAGRPIEYKTDGRVVIR